MRTLLTTYFGQLEYANDTVFEFAEGLPGFEDEHAFVFIRRPNTEPMIFMQSLQRSELCFLMLPVYVACPDYRLNLSPEDLTKLGFPVESQPVIGNDVLCGALVTVREGMAPTVNLLAPVVVNLRDRKGIQAIQADGSYSHQHRLFVEEMASTC